MKLVSRPISNRNEVVISDAAPPIRKTWITLKILIFLGALTSKKKTRMESGTMADPRKKSPGRKFALENCLYPKSRIRKATNNRRNTLV